MEIRELASLTNEVIDRVVPLLEDVPAATRDIASIRGANGAGEWLIALSNLVGVVAEEGVVITAADHRDLKRLLDDFADSASEDTRSEVAIALSDLERITVG